VPPRSRLLLATAVVLSACRNPTAPTPPPILTTTANIVVFYDENGNGTLDTSEAVRLPKVTLKIDVALAQTDATGRASLFTNQGAQTLLVDPASLPPGYAAPATMPVTLPAAGDIRVPVTLPIKANHPNVYMTYGDSITADLGYPEILVDRLKAYFGVAFLNDEGLSGTRTDEGARQIQETLDVLRPAYVLILYGTNDWNACQSQIPCFTIDSLRLMIDDAKRSGCQVFLATIPPVNVGFSDLASPERQDWVHQMNTVVRGLARQEGVVLVDIEKVFLADPDQPSLFDDHVHPSSKGVGIIVDEFFRAITRRAPPA
jgi:lysophospholipase L1-like esterase